jgi:N-acetylmuramoyl-L-alanine amidase
MPSVLIEVAFMSNRVEERLLNQGDFRKSVAKAIYEGITNFVDLYRQESSVDAESQ